MKDDFNRVIEKLAIKLSNSFNNHPLKSLLFDLEDQDLKIAGLSQA